MKKIHIYFLVFALFADCVSALSCIDEDNTEINNLKFEKWDESYTKETGAFSEESENEIIAYKSDFCVGDSDILLESYCDGTQPDHAEIDCSKFGKSCYIGACLTNMDLSQMQFICRNRGCNYKLPEFEGDSCGSRCPENKCEDEYFHGDESTGYSGGYRYVRYLLEYNGVARGSKCIIRGCNPIYIEAEYCSLFQKDSDGDGVLDLEDECQGELYTNLLDNLKDYEKQTEINEVGCPEVSLSRDVCMPVGKDSIDETNVNIVLYPCGLGKNPSDESIFYYWSKLTASGFSETEPYKSNPEKYKFYYLWNTDKKDVITPASFDDLEICLGEVQKIESIVDMADGCPKANRLVYIIAYRAYSVALGMVLDLGSPFGAQTLGKGKCCPENIMCCESYNNEFVETALHEVGHSLKLNHIEYEEREDDFSYFPRVEFVDGDGLDFRDKVNNLYTPEVYPITPAYVSEEPCPIWDYDAYKKFEKKTGLDMMCVPGQLMSQNTFGSVHEYTLMYPSSYQAEDYIFDPVSAKLINDALEIGYDRYKSLTYPYNCEKIIDSTYFKEIFMKEPENRGKKIEDVAAECLIKACRYVEENRKEECCMLVREISNKEEHYDKCINN